MSDPKDNSNSESEAGTAADAGQVVKPEMAAEASFYKPSDESVSSEESLRLWVKKLVDALIRRELPLQNETSYFILVNMLDFFVTYSLLSFGAIEANPLADYFLKNWGHAGMLWFKLASVAFICILSQLIALISFRHARFVLIAGTVIVSIVVVYSLFLLARMT